jgi:hypothetical protein
MAKKGSFYNNGPHIHPTMGESIALKNTTFSLQPRADWLITGAGPRRNDFRLKSTTNYGNSERGPKYKNIYGKSCFFRLHTVVVGPNPIVGGYC